MSLGLRILLILLTIGAVAAIPAFFKISNPSKKFPKNVTTAGWWFIGSIVVACIVNIYLEWHVNQEANADKKSLEGALKEMRTAIERSGLRYDSATQKITQINVGQSTIVAGDGVRIEGNQFNDNRIAIGRYPPEGVREITMAVVEKAGSTNHKNITVSVQAVQSTLGMSAVIPLLAELANEGFKTKRLPHVHPIVDPRLAMGCKVERPTANSIVVTIGNIIIYGE